MTAMSPPEATTPEILILDHVATPVGTALVVVDEGGALRALDFEDYAERMHRLLARHYGAMPLERGAAPRIVSRGLKDYFAGDLSALDDLVWKTNGTDFQRKVWGRLTTIPAGETWNYKRLAQSIGSPNAARAVGLANGANPIAIRVACHRVIGADGTLTGYGGGLERKAWLLRHEGVVL